MRRRLFIAPRRMVLSAVLALVLMAPSGPAEASVPATVWAPDSRPHGKTYGDWAALWWQWAYSIPLYIDSEIPSRGFGHPLLDTTGALCGVSQSGPVWYLAFAFPTADVSTVTRQCTVPVGKGLLIPLGPMECSRLAGDGTTEAELRACVRAKADTFTNLAVTIDDVPVPRITRYRAESRLFSFRLPVDNLLGLFGFDIPDGTYWPMVADGYFVVVKPLPVGQHTIRFQATFPSLGRTETIYHLTVK